jgi:pimeloyl-ACP methyl ester carboxylesterase
MTGRSAAGRGRQLRLLAVILFVLAVLAGCSIGPSQRPPLATFGTAQNDVATSPSTSSPPLGPGGPGQQADPIRWAACGDVDSVDRGSGLSFDVDCGEVQVDRPSGGFGAQTMRVARARVADLPQDAPTIVVLDGQPGENGRSSVATVAAGLSPAVRQHFAVVAVDLIGSGGSEPIDCLSSHDAGMLTSLGVDPTEPAAAAALADLARSLTFECGDVAGAELSLVNSTMAADDLDALRSALGTQRLSLIGRGFGATLGAVYADRYPGRVGAAVLDAPADPLEAPDVRLAAIAVAAERALDSFAAQCPTFTGGCPLGTDPRAQIDKAVASLDAVPGSFPGSGSTNGGSVLLALLVRIGDPADWPDLATALAAAAAGNGQPIDDLLRDALGLSGQADWLGAAIIYACNDAALRISPDQLSAAVDKVRPQAPLLGPFTLGLLAVCSSWPAPENALGGVRATGAAPILLTAAVDDPVAPYQSVQSLAGQLGSARLISWQSGQHGSYPASSCITSAVDGYLLQGRLPAVGSLCPP